MNKGFIFLGRLIFMDYYYILDNKKHIMPTKNMIEYAVFMSNPLNRTVKEDFIDQIRISTVFLGINHEWNLDKPPLLFETMVFSDNIPEIDKKMNRYSTWEEAEAGHDEMKILIKTLYGGTQINILN